ncbi:MAG: 1-phosphofructokinase family hexose kinase [Leucobacter sp.]
MTGIVTVTASAAIDRTYQLDRVVPGAVNRADTVSSELSGKGVNVAAAIAQASQTVRAVVPLSASELHWTGDEKFYEPVIISRSTRVNITLMEANGLTTKVNEQAVPLELNEWGALVATSVRALNEIGGGWLVLCGTMPSLVSGGMVPLEELLTAAAAAGARIAIDSSGEGLLRALAHPVRLELIKPNTHELAELIKRDLNTIGEVVMAARELQARHNIGTVFVSMGADGALVVGPDDYRLATARAESVVNTVGAGDASLAGYLVAVAEAGIEARDLAAERAAAWGALAVSQRGTVLAAPDTAPKATVTVPAPDTVLTEPGRA